MKHTAELLDAETRSDKVPGTYFPAANKPWGRG